MPRASRSYHDFTLSGILNSVLIIVLIGLLSQYVFAQETRSSEIRANRAMIYHGKLVRPGGAVINGPREMEIKIFSPEPSLCLLWAEKQTVQLTNGGFSAEVGHSVNRLSGSAGGIASNFKEVFINNSGLSLSGANCASGSSYTPGSADDRLMNVTFNDEGTAVAITGLPIKSVPFALQAEEVSGFGISNLFKISGSGSSVSFAPAEVGALKDMLSGAADWDLKNKKISNLASPIAPTDAATKAWVQAEIASIPVSGSGTVTSVNVAGLPLSVTNASTTPTLSIAQASGVQAGYLSAADWTMFNNKQPAGNYLTAITSGNVTAALGFTPADASSSVFTNALLNGGNTGAVVMGSNDAASVSVETAGTTRLTVDASGNIGIGTSSPTVPLEISSGTTGLPVLISSDSNRAGIVIANTATTGTTNTSEVRLQGFDGAAVSTIGQLFVNDSAFVSGSAPANSIGLRASRETGSIIFQTPQTGINTTRMTIDSAGKVGIGTTSPSSLLEISGGSPILKLTDSAGPISATVSGGSGHINLTTASTARDLTINGGSGNAVMTVKGGGNVGIGTTSPGDKLHVNGKIRAQEICDTTGANCKVISSGWTAGSVTAVDVGGLPLSVVNGSSTPTISINQANGSQAGFLSAADWTLFNSKQPAGAYLTGITGSQVTSALGFTPLSSTSSSEVISALGYSPITSALPSNQVFIGNGSNIAVAGFFGVGNLRNSSGTVQFPSSCAASQTLTWSAITDVFSCTNIGFLPASAISSGTIDGARLPFGASLWQDGAGGKIYYNGGNVGIGTISPNAKLNIEGSGANLLQLRSLSNTGNGSVVRLESHNDGGDFEIINNNGVANLSYTRTEFTKMNRLVVKPGGMTLDDWPADGGAYIAGSLGVQIQSPLIPFAASPVLYNSGTASQSGNLVTGIGTSWTSAMVGALFSFGDGYPVGVISSVLSTTSLTVNYSQTVGAKTYKIHYPGLNVNASGFVGVGTSAPISPFTIYSSSGNDTMSLIRQQTGSSPSVATYQSNSSDPTTLLNDKLFRLRFYGNDGSDHWQAGEIGAYNDAFISQENIPSAIYFSTTPSGGELTQRLTIRSSGNVGIGTTSPQSKLQISGGEIQVGTGGGGCSAGNAGAIRYTGGALSYCNGTAWTSISSGGGGSGGCGVQGSRKNLKITVTSSTAAVLSADASCLFDGTGYHTFRNVSCTLSTATNGLNAIDTGTVAANTWYSVWVVHNGTSAGGCTLSISSTTPAAAITATYPYVARAGWVRTNGSGNLIATIQAGTRAQWLVGGANMSAYPVLASGSNGNVCTAISISSYAPPTAGAITLQLTGNPTGGQGGVLAANNNCGQSISSLANGNGGGITHSSLTTFVLESTNVYYASGSGATSVISYGWEDNL